MNTTTFPPKIYPQTERATKTLSVSVGFAQLRSLADGSRVKAYIVDHEAPALVLLALCLIAGTVFYVDFRPRLDAASEPAQNTPSLKLAAAPIQQRATDEFSLPIAAETASDMGSTTPNPPSTSSIAADQSNGLVSNGEPIHHPIHRKGVRHHHRR